MKTIHIIPSNLPLVIIVPVDDVAHMTNKYNSLRIEVVSQPYRAGIKRRIPRLAALVTSRSRPVISLSIRDHRERKGALRSVIELKSGLIPLVQGKTINEILLHLFAFWSTQSPIIQNKLRQVEA